MSTALQWAPAIITAVFLVAAVLNIDWGQRGGL